MKIKKFKYGLLWISIHAVIFFFLFGSSCSLWGQGGQKVLTPADYTQWETMLPNNLSVDGQWVSYGLRIFPNKYSITVKNTATGEYFEIENCFDYKFSENGDWFFALDMDGQLHYIDLLTLKEYKIDNVLNYRISTNSQFFAYIVKGINEKNNNLKLKNLRTGSIKTFERGGEFTFAPNGKYLAIVQAKNTSKQLSILALDKENETVIGAWPDSITSLLWTPNSKGIAFIGKNETGINEMYWCGDIHDPKSLKNFGSDSKKWKISDDSGIPNLFSTNSKRLFFQASPKEDSLIEPKNLQKDADVEVWNTKDEFLYSAQENINGYWSKLPSTIAWEAKTGQWHPLGSEEAKRNISGDGGSYSYSYTYKVEVLASYDRETSSSIFVSDLRTGSTKPVVKKNTGLEFKVSPSGRYLSYFKDGDWILYDPQEDTYTNLTKNLNISFSDSLSINLPFSACGNPGWTANEKEILLYDSYDIWAISPDAKTHRRITHGRERNRIYRFYTLIDDSLESSKFDISHYDKYFDLKKRVILSARDLDTGATGYFRYSQKNGMDEIVFKDAFISNLRISKNGESAVYSEEKFDLPPRLMYKSLKGNKTKIVYQSNPQHFNYKWGSEKLIAYKNVKGDSLKGILYYPSNFDPNKKYPMVVSIYQMQSDKMFTYQNPSKYNGAGFSISDYTANGYFVFLPDIINEIQNPGISALQCVMAGVEKVGELPYIDTHSVGLWGHSFGGYETLFIIAHTNFFATAIAGAGIANLLSFTNSVAWSWNWPQYARVENQQWRFGNSYFNIPEAYERNSPINYVQNIKTPLLSWSGKEDGNVNWQQSVEFYIALRKLQKDHIMLLYKNEDHALSKLENQLDLSNKTMQWFDHYLKNFDLPNWMTEK